MRLIIQSFILLSLVVGPITAGAQADETGEPSVRERVQQELEQYREDLQLSNYQWSQVELILKSGIRERIAIAQQHGVDEIDDWSQLDRKAKRELSKDMKESRKNTAERMERYLTKDQMKAFEDYQDEQRDRLLARLEPGSNG